MIPFERFTTEYDPVEDRIRINGVGAAGQRVTLWLNQRMMRLLLPQLCNWVEAKVSTEQGGRSPAVQEFHQAAAAATLTPDQPPVAPLGSGVLVVSIDYTDLGNVIRLTFKNLSGTQLALVDFPEMGLRQWLAIVHGLYLAADWPVDPFPAWLISNSTTCLN